MHRVTTNNEFHVVSNPRGGGGWQASIVFQVIPEAVDPDEVSIPDKWMGADRAATVETGDYSVGAAVISIVSRSPDSALGSLWALCDDLGAWDWNECE